MTENPIVIASYIEVDGLNYGPVSPTTDTINGRVYDFMSKNNCSYIQRQYAETCGGGCWHYFTCSGKRYVYIVVSLGWWHGVNNHLGDINRARQAIYESIAHEYFHVMQQHLIDPVYPTRWFGEETGLDGGKSFRSMRDMQIILHINAKKVLILTRMWDFFQ